VVPLLGVADGDNPQTFSYVRKLATDPRIALVPKSGTCKKIQNELLAALA
jgi:hypothetical protein